MARHSHAPPREAGAAERANRHLTLLFANLHDAVIIVDQQGKIIDWNPAAQRTFGYRKEEMLGRTPASLRPEDEEARQGGQIATALTRQGRWQGELVFLRKDGTRVICESVISTLED